jgi:Ala-tRNA(Pro) deacylase
MPNPLGSSFARQIPLRLINCLNRDAVRYEILHHRLDSSDSPRRAAVPGLIETAVVRAGNQRVLTVMPAGRIVDLKRFAKCIGESVRLETEDEFKWLFPDCALGAIPPFGNLYGLATWVDNSVAKTEHICFFAGTLNDSIKIAYSAYADIVRPNLAAFSGKGQE